MVYHLKSVTAPLQVACVNDVFFSVCEGRSTAKISGKSYGNERQGYFRLILLVSSPFAFSRSLGSLSKHNDNGNENYKIKKKTFWFNEQNSNSARALHLLDHFSLSL